MNLAVQNPNGTAPSGAAPQTAVDLWDFGETGATSGHVSQEHHFSEIVGGAPPKSSANIVGIIVAVILLGVFGYFGWVIYSSDEDPVQKILAMVGLADEPLDDPALNTPPPKKKPPKKQPVVEKVPKIEPTTPPEVSVAGNPYWALPNKLDGENKPLARAWNPEEEEAMRAGMAHQFTYQRWQTVQNLRTQRYRGSDALLWEALAERKFWTRMWALVGLAEFNIELSLQVVEETIGDARSELVADFFERLDPRGNAGQRYVMRQAIKLLDEKGRLVVIKNLVRSRDTYSDLYLAAATLDPSPKVQTWAKKKLASTSIPAETYDRYVLAIQNGALDGVLEGKAPSTISDASLEPIAVGQAVDDLSNFEDYGEVMFFEGGEEFEEGAGDEAEEDLNF